MEKKFKENLQFWKNVEKIKSGINVEWGKKIWEKCGKNK